MPDLHHGRTAARADAFARSPLTFRVAPLAAALALTLSALAACAVPGAPGGGAVAPGAASPTAPSAGSPASRLAPAPAWPAATDADRAALAPTGVLRVAVYPGSPTSLVKAGDERGVTVELGRAMAQALGVPATLVPHERVAQIVEALQAGRVDMTITNATPARARLVDFGPVLLQLELGVLVPAGTTRLTAADMDQPGARIGVTQGSSSQAALGPRLRQATLRPLPDLAGAARALQAGELDAFATNKAILHELADTVPGARVLEGRWGLEQMALAVPRGREAGHAWLARFTAAARERGLVADAARRAGLRGLATDTP